MRPGLAKQACTLAPHPPRLLTLVIGSLVVRPGSHRRVHEKQQLLPCLRHDLPLPAALISGQNAVISPSNIMSERDLLPRSCKTSASCIFFLLTSSRAPANKRIFSENTCGATGHGLALPCWSPFLRLSIASLTNCAACRSWRLIFFVSVSL